MAVPQKRIAIVCLSRSLGGLELTALHLADTMRSKGVSTLLVIPPASPLEERAQACGVETCVLTARWKYFDLTAAVKFSRLLKHERVDVAMLMRSQDINLASIAKLFYPSVKLVFYQQMRSQHDKRDMLHTWIYSKLSLWISLTQGMKEDVLDFTRMPREKVTVVPLGTDLHRFDPSRFNAAEARASFGLPCDTTIVAVLGRLDPGKGQEVLLRAIPDVTERHSKLLFLIVGDETVGEPGYKKVLTTLCAGLGVEAWVRFMNFTDDVPRLMAAIDVLVLPSFSETFGLVLIEAMAMEKAVVATNAGGVPEIITNNQTGLLVKPRDEASLADALNHVLDDDSLRRRLARQGRTEAVARYDFDHCVEILLDRVCTL